jgi:acetyl esterase/lipase
VLLNLHGGGFCLGAAIDDDWFCDLIARLARVAVVSIDYRLAPEHPYPAGVEDCLAAALWLAENAHAEFGTDRLIVGGSSAGGYFAAQALLGLRRHGLIDRVVAANLVFGGYDLSMTPSQRSATDETLVLTQSWLRGFRQLFLPGLAPEDARDPAISPLYADLSGLPPALFTVGTLDPLLDDSLFMAARWRAAGNAAQLDTWPDCVHGFMNMYPVTGRAAWTGVAEWLSGQLTAAGQ